MEYVFLMFIIIIFIATAGWFINTYNSFQRIGIKVEEADAGIDVSLTKRYDVLTSLVEVVKGYANYEKEVLVEVVQLRQGMSIKERTEVNQKMDNNFEKINVLVESYPNLKANENFIQLQRTIVDVEDHLQASRRMYNSNVSIYNQLVQSFPSNLVASMIKVKEKDFFAVDEMKKETVKIAL